MFDWIGQSVSNFTDWVGNGFASLLEWLLGGLADMVTIVVDATNGIWSVFDALWNLGSSFIGSLTSIMGVLFSFMPAPVAAVFSSGLIAVLIAGIFHAVRGK